MIVYNETTRMNVVHSGGGQADANPDISLTNRGGVYLAVLHLTRGKGRVIGGQTNQGARNVAAIEFSGSVDVTMEGDSPGDWEFNFIQLIYQPLQRLTYAGVTPEDGSMVMTLTEASPQYRLDNADPATAPYSHRDPAVPVLGSRGRSGFGNSAFDHPNAGNLFLVAKNYVTGKTNYLIRAQKQYFFFTAFVAKDTLNRRSSDYVTLAHVRWMILWDAGIWYNTASFAANPFMMRRKFDVDPVVRAGAPAEFRRMIERPTTDPREMFGAINREQFNSAFNTTSDNRNCQASDKWPVDIAPSFVPH